MATLTLDGGNLRIGEPPVTLHFGKAAQGVTLDQRAAEALLDLLDEFMRSPDRQFFRSVRIPSGILHVTQVRGVATLSVSRNGLATGMQADLPNRRLHELSNALVSALPSR